MGRFTKKNSPALIILILFLLFLNAGCPGNSTGTERDDSLDDNDAEPEQDDDNNDNNNNDSNDDDDNDTEGETNSDYQDEALVMNIEWDVYHHNPIILAVDKDRVKMIGGEWDDGTITFNAESLPLVPLQIIELQPGRNKIRYQNGTYTEELLVRFKDDLSIQTGTVEFNLNSKDEPIQLSCLAGSCVPEVLILENTGSSVINGVQFRTVNDAPLKAPGEFFDWLPSGLDLPDMVEANMGIVRKHIIASKPSWFNSDSNNGYYFPEQFRDDGLDFCSGMSTALARLFWMEGLEPVFGRVMQQPVYGHVSMSLIDAQGSHWMDPYYCVWGEENGQVVSFSKVARYPEKYILPWADPSGEGPCGQNLHDLVSAIQNGSEYVPGPAMDFSIMDGLDGGFIIQAGHSLILMPNHTGKAFRICPEKDSEECVRLPDEEPVGSFIDQWETGELSDILYSQLYPLHGVIISGFDKSMIGKTVTINLAFDTSSGGQDIQATVLGNRTINLSEYFIHTLEYGLIRYFCLQFHEALNGDFKIQVLGQFARRNWPTGNEILFDASDEGELEVVAATDQNVGNIAAAEAYWRHEGCREDGPSVLQLPTNGKSFATIEVSVVSSTDEEKIRRVPGIYIDVVADSQNLKLTPPSKLYHETKEAVPTKWTGSLRLMSPSGSTMPWQVRCLNAGRHEVEVFADNKLIQTLQVNCNQ